MLLPFAATALSTLSASLAIADEPLAHLDIAVIAIYFVGLHLNGHSNTGEEFSLGREMTTTPCERPHLRNGSPADFSDNLLQPKRLQVAATGIK